MPVTFILLLVFLLILNFIIPSHAASLVRVLSETDLSLYNIVLPIPAPLKEMNLVTTMLLLTINVPTRDLQWTTVLENQFSTNLQLTKTHSFSLKNGTAKHLDF